MHQIDNGWVMAISLGAVCMMTLALIHVPGFRPGPEVLACDRMGGAWSSAEHVCHLAGNRLAGMSP